jgi:putative tryptophan/tyrosine transport system substrate-binding protein
MNRRREFIAGLGSTVAWPVVGRAQQPDRVRRIGVLMGYGEDDPLAKLWLSWFTQALEELGWTDGRNVRMDLRWGSGDTNRIRALARELVGFQPDIILTGSTATTAAAQGETRTIPIVSSGMSIPSPAASSHGSIARLGTSPASPSRKPRWVASGLSCSRRSLPGSSGPR